MTDSHFARGAAIVFSALSLIVCGDVAGKLLTEGGASPFFVAWTRFAIAVLVVLPFSGIRFAELRQLWDWRLLLRASLIVAAICSIMTALKTEPIANVFGAFFISPIVSYVLSAVLLKEAISKTRTLLLLIGFAGVLLVVKPGFGATPGMGFAVLAGCLHGSYLVATRWLAHAYRPRFLLMSQLMLGSVVLSPLGLASEPPVIDTALIWLIAISALGSAAGNYLLVIANRTMPASTIAPLIYTQLIVATLAGYLVFSDWPDLVSFIGLAVILGSGLMSIWVANRPALRV